jgi:hypothetical protein
MRAVMTNGKPYTEEHWHDLELNVRLAEIETFFTMPMLIKIIRTITDRWFLQYRQQQQIRKWSALKINFKNEQN